MQTRVVCREMFFLPLQKIKFRQVHTEQEWPIIKLFLIHFAFVSNVWCKFTTDAHCQYQADEERKKKKMAKDWIDYNC